MENNVRGKFFTPEELERIYRTNRKVFFSYACKLSGDGDLAEDIMSDVYLRILKHNPFVKNGNLFSYFTGCIYNRYLTLRKINEKTSLFSHMYEDEIERNEGFKVQPNENEEDEEMSLLDKAVSELTPALRTNFYYRITNGLTADQTAKVLESTEGAIKTKTNTMYNSLRRSFRKRGIEWKKKPIIFGSRLERKLA